MSIYFQRHSENINYWIFYFLGTITISFSWKIPVFAAEKKTMSSETSFLTVLTAVPWLTNTGTSQRVLAQSSAMSLHPQPQRACNVSITFPVVIGRYLFYKWTKSALTCENNEILVSPSKSEFSLWGILFFCWLNLEK